MLCVFFPLCWLLTIIAFFFSITITMNLSKYIFQKETSCFREHCGLDSFNFRWATCVCLYSSLCSHMSFWQYLDLLASNLLSLEQPVIISGSSKYGTQVYLILLPSRIQIALSACNDLVNLQFINGHL